MKNKIIAIVAAATTGAGGAYVALERQTQSRVLEVQAEATSIREDLFGYTKYTDYIEAGKQVLTEQAKFLAAKVVRDYVVVEHLEAGRFGLTSNATVIVDYAVEYSFGFDLKPDSFEIRATPAGIELKIGKPILVASPAVTPMKFDIPNKGVLTDEKTAVIGIQQRLPAIALKRGVAMAQEEPIRAVCEKKLVEFLHGFLGKQPGVKQVPAITVVYR
jgi:hypothetical protein